MAATFYPKFKTALLKGDVDLDAATLKIALIDTGTYTYNAAHDFYDDLSGVVGTDQTLANVTIGVVSEGTIDADNPTWSGLAGATVEAYVMYISTGVAGTSRLVSYHDGVTLTPDGSNVTLNFHANGIATL